MTNAQVSQVVADAVTTAIADCPIDADSPAPPAAQKAIHLAAKLQRRACELQTSAERKQQDELDRIINNPHDKATMVQMTDQAFRASSPRRSADQLIHILDVQGVPMCFGFADRTMLKGFQLFGGFLPGLSVPLAKGHMQKETANVVLPAEREELNEYLRARRKEGVRMNVNYLGEAILGEAEAAQRMKYYMTALEQPEIEVVSIKISTMYSQIHSLAFEETVATLCDRLEPLYRKAAAHTFKRNDGTVVPKFVYLDMEEYRDMELTAETFMQTLDRPGMENISGGIALQAYIPDSFAIQQRINAWARDRVAAGGAPVTIRIVKGANMEMERVEASHRVWPQAPFKRKIETDANYKRMLCEGMKPQNIAAVRLGIASHNVFELCYGLVLACESGQLHQVQFEMLEGMSNHVRRALFELVGNVLLYAPVCRREDFIHAIGYLIRRLDENTGPENFLRHAFKIQVGSEDWQRLEGAFLDSFGEMEARDGQSRRSQDRHLPAQSTTPVNSTADFINEPDTDFCLRANVAWGKQIIADWHDRCDDQAANIPLVIDGAKVNGHGEPAESFDPSRPGTVVARVQQANADDIERAVQCAKADPTGWRKMAGAKRREILFRVADELRAARGEMLGIAMAEGGKLLYESDPEHSEAIDFVEFYARTAAYFEGLAGVKASPRGVVAVVPPWNFPIAIPCGGIAAALAAGNTVIVKPSPDTVYTAYRVCQCFWDAGVSQSTLQFTPCSVQDGARQLVSHADVDTVILTGGTETALAMLAAKPSMRLLAETGGKNATIVTSLADRDQAAKHVLQSAFSHSGQKCSATSLLVLEDEVYRDEKFREALVDGAKSMKVGSAWDVQTKIGPLIRPPAGKLAKGLSELSEGESWLLQPRMIEDNPHLYTPGIKWGVKPGNYTHTTELFGPVLSVMRASNLKEAIQIVNATGFGLTSGLQSLDEREQDQWVGEIAAGNLYINRTTVGAIVLRQPFGGFGLSAFGPGIKAGGPNYVATLMRFEDAAGAPADETDIVHENLSQIVRQLQHSQRNKSRVGGFETSEIDRTTQALRSIDHWMLEEFMIDHDHFNLVGQDNIRRYLPVQRLVVRVQLDDSPSEIWIRIAGARAAGCGTILSVPIGAKIPAAELVREIATGWHDFRFIEQSDEALAEQVRSRKVDRVRYAAASVVPAVVRKAAAESGVYIADEEILTHGRIESLWYLREQSLCNDYHRYGNLGDRGEEQRAEPL